MISTYTGGNSTALHFCRLQAQGLLVTLCYKNDAFINAGMASVTFIMQSLIKHLCCYLLGNPEKQSTFIDLLINVYRKKKLFLTSQGKKRKYGLRCPEPRTPFLWMTALHSHASPLPQSNFLPHLQTKVLIVHIAQCFSICRNVIISSSFHCHMKIKYFNHPLLHQKHFMVPS